MKQLSASSVGHALRGCAFPFRADTPTTPRPAGASAAFGTEVHDAAEGALTGKPREKLSDNAKRHLAQIMAWVDSSSPTKRRPELVERGFLYNVRTDSAEWGPRRGQAGYDVTPPGCIRGTLDFGFVPDHPGELWLVDLKTGAKTDNVEQLLMQALAVSRILKVQRVHVGFLYSRLTLYRAPEWMTLNADALDEFAGRLHRLIRTLPTAQATRWDGCRWCEVKSADCPALNVSLQQQHEEHAA